MNSQLFIQIALILVAIPAAAQPQDIPRAKIEKVLGAYANSVGCAFAMDRKNIVKLDIYGDGEKESQVFVALFVNDDECSGGSGSWASKLAILEQHNGGIYILPEMTMPLIASSGLPRFIDRIFIKNRQLWFTGRIHADKDGNNFPTIHVQAQLQFIHTAVKTDAKHNDVEDYWKSSKDFEGR